MAKPGKFSLSAPFARLLAEFEIASDLADGLMLMHAPCWEEVRAVERDDTLDSLVQAAIDHDCPDE